MTESGPETSLSESERRHDKVRERIIDALSLIVAIAVVLHTRPDSIIATFFVGAGVALALRICWPASALLLGLLTVALYFSTIMQAMNFSLPVVLLAMFVPGIAQAYVIWALWAATSVLLHPLTLMCLVWLALLGIWLLEKNVFANRRPQQSH